MRKHANVIFIIKALPFYHFLSGLSVPNQPPHITLANVSWGSNVLDLIPLKVSMEDKPG